MMRELLLVNLYLSAAIGCNIILEGSFLEGPTPRPISEPNQGTSPGPNPGPTSAPTLRPTPGPNPMDQTITDDGCDALGGDWNLPGLGSGRIVGTHPSKRRIFRVCRVKERDECVICADARLKDHWKLQLKVHEGYCEKIYKDSEGYLTFGIGHRIKFMDPEDGSPCGTSVTATRALSAFDADMASVETDIYRLYPNFDTKPYFVQMILGDMMFNLGYPRFSKFVKMKACLDAEDYNCAADEMIDSRWCGQVGQRCNKLVSMMRSESMRHGYTNTDINTSQCNTC